MRLRPPELLALCCIMALSIISISLLANQTIKRQDLACQEGCTVLSKTDLIRFP